MENESKAKKIVCTILLVVIVSLVGVALSYSFFNNFVKKSGGENNPAEVTSGELDIKFDTSQYINNGSAELITEEELTDDSDYATKFTVDKSTKSTATHIKYDVYLKDIKISDNLKNSDYLKWKLVNEKTGSSVKGDFKNIVESTCSGSTEKCYTLYLSNGNILSGKTDYTLYIYLEYSSTENQNSMLEGTISTKVAIDSYTY